VILTGVALRRETAQAIAAVLAEQGGEFVCATAGHHMECMLAVYGSGAARRSYDGASRILNIDIGGGTSKLGLVRNGELQATAAVHVGGRLLVVDETGRIVRLDPAGRAHALRAGFDWQVGSMTQPQQLTRVAESMADALLRIVKSQYIESDVQELLLTDPLPEIEQLDGVMFSGGVGEYVYGREPRDFGDLGKRLGEAIRARLDAGALGWKLLEAGECIRATVLGASEYSVQLSGNTTFISEPGALLPRKNLQVVPMPLALDEHIDPAEVRQALARSFLRHDLEEGAQDNAVSLRWSGSPTYERLSALAKGLLDALPRTLQSGRPLYFIVDGDIALTLGHLMKEDPRVAGEVLVIDGITLWGFDFVDLGRIRMPSMTVPVTIKSLVFSEDPRSHGKSDPSGWHRHGDGALHKHDQDHSHDHGHGHDHGHHHHHEN
jgi:ethanolamine utilization protein EutA